MIFTLNKSVQNGDISILAKAILLISEKHHHLLMSNDVHDWLGTTILDTPDYLGRIDRDALKNNHELWRVTKMQQNYQTKISVGLENDSITIEQLYAIVNEPSYVVLENSVYDWAVICRWVDVYRTEREFKSLNESLYRAIKENNLRADHSGGGNGSIKNKIYSLVDRYKGQAVRKITTIYDSDKTCVNDKVDHNKALNLFLNTSGFIGHELYKREMENYFSIDTLRAAGMVNENAVIPKFTPDEYDFVDLEKESFTNYKKNLMPHLTEFLYKQSLKERVSHHKLSDSVDEIQSIIITLARFI